MSVVSRTARTPASGARSAAVPAREAARARAPPARALPRHRSRAARGTGPTRQVTPMSRYQRSVGDRRRRRDEQARAGGAVRTALTTLHEPSGARARRRQSRRPGRSCRTGGRGRRARGSTAAPMITTASIVAKSSGRSRPVSRQPGDGGHGDTRRRSGPTTTTASAARRNRSVSTAAAAAPASERAEGVRRRARRTRRG